MPLSNQREAAAAAQPRLRRRHLKYRGVRKRSWGRWVAEIRVPKSHDRLWLGSYASPHQAARAYDVAAACLRGPASALNLPMYALPQPGHCLSPTSIRKLAAQEAARFTFLDEHQPAPPAPSSASPISASIMQHGSNNPDFPPPPLAPLASDRDNLQLEQPDQHVGCPVNPLDYHLSSVTEILNNHQINSAEVQSFHNRDPTELHNFQGRNPTELEQNTSQTAPQNANLARDQSLIGTRSLLDLWFSLDIGPAVEPSLKALLTHSLYPDSGQL